MSRRRTVEYSPHYSPKPDRPLKFGEPLPKPRRGRQASSRKPLSGGGFVPQDLGLIPAEGSGEIANETSARERGWETYILDRGTGTQETIEGRSYAIGKDHPLVDVWTSPPETWGAKRIESVRNCRIIVLRRKPSEKNDESNDPLIKSWPQAIIIDGVSKPRSNVIIPMEFSDGLGSRMIVSVAWRQIRR